MLSKCTESVTVLATASPLAASCSGANSVPRAQAPPPESGTGAVGRRVLRRLLTITVMGAAAG